MNKVDYTKLHEACNNGDLNKVKLLLRQQEYQLEINTIDGLLGYSPLHEAVCARNAEIIKELLRFNANINVKAHDNYTPLHIAASLNYCEGISILLSHGADINQFDSFGRTPCRTAEIYHCHDASRLLRSEEIYSTIRRPLSSSSQFHNSIKDLKLNDVEENFFQKCLDIVVENDTYAAIKVVLSFKKINIKDCLEKAFRRPHCSKTLLMVFLLYVVFKKNNDILKFLIDPITNNSPKGLGSLDIEVSAERLFEMRLFISEIKEDLNFHVSLACSDEVKNYEAVKILLKNQYYNKDSQVASWNRLNLTCLKDNWFQEITILDLKLCDNAIKKFQNSLPNYLKLVKTIDLSNNKLKAIPSELLMLPNLWSLSLSSNQLQQLPNVKNWSPFEKLNLNDNNLKSFPDNVDQLFVKHLYIAGNQLKCIPESICRLKHLVSLDISRNSDIHQIPTAIGKMKTLSDLIIKGLMIKDPPLDYLNNVSTSHIKNFLIARSRSSVPYYIMKLMIVGFSKQGKTTLLRRLQNDIEYNQDIRTAGIDIQNVTITRSLKPNYIFRAWDFAGQEEYYITHQCFMSGSSLYLLLWDINEKQNGLKMLKAWLESLFARSIHFSLIIIATKIDLLKENSKLVIDDMKSEIYRLFHSTPAFSRYRELVDKFPLMFLSLNPKYESYTKDMNDLKSKIYEVASKMKCEGDENENFMGRLVPESYMKLDFEIGEKRKLLKKNDIPIINREELFQIATSLSFKGDKFSESDIDTAALFLHTTGTILYFNTAHGCLKNMYFICPSWVCQLMSKLITDDCVHKFITNGILQKSNIPLILENNLFGEMSTIVKVYLRLLSIFQVAIEIDICRVFVPSKLPLEAPLHSSNHSGPLLKRYHFFPWIPFGFWARFTSLFLALMNEILLPHTLEYFATSVDLGYLLDKNVIKCWRKGLIFDHPNIYFSIQEIESKKKGMDTIETCVQHSPLGYRILSYIVDQIRTVLFEWFQGVLYFTDNYTIESCFECPTCNFLGINPPILFDINYAFEKVYQNMDGKSYSLVCELNHVPKVINLADCCPDLTFRDLTDEFKLCGNDIIYTKTDKLATGECGDIYRGSFKNEIVAIKCYKYSGTNDSNPSKLTFQRFYEFRQEVLMINKLFHPYIIKFMGVSFKPELCVVLEYAKYGSLATVIHGSNSVVLPRMVRLRICQQIASALSFMHNHYIVHRDIKSDNILVFSLALNSKINIKLTDFNTANFMSWCGLKNVTGTKGYSAPEIISSKLYLDNYTLSIDVYSFSIVIYELITYKRPFYQVKNCYEIDSSVREGFRPMFYNMHYAFYGLINLTKLMTMMWHQEPSKRPNIKDIVSQMRSPAFQLIFGIKLCYLHNTDEFGIKKLQSFSPREICYIHKTDELWVSCDNIADTFIVILKLALADNNSQMQKNLSEEKIEIDVKGLIQNSFYVTLMVAIGDGSHLCVVLRSNYDLILVYEIKTRKVLIRRLMKEAIIDSICCRNDWMYLGCRSSLMNVEPLFYKVNIKEVINNNLFNFSNVELDFQVNQTLTVIAVSSSILLKSVGRCISYVKFDTNRQGVKPCHRTQNVRDIIFSLDEKIFFISFQCSTEIFVCDAEIESQTDFIEYDCRQDIEKCTPSAIIFDLRVSCMCSVYNTLWIGTGSGHILIYEVLKPPGHLTLLLALHPYKTEMRRFAIIRCPKREDKVEYLVATIGRELNGEAFGNNSIFKCGETPVDETAEAQLPYRPIRIEGKKEKVILIWQALIADEYKSLVLDV